MTRRKMLQNASKVLLSRHFGVKMCIRDRFMGHLMSAQSLFKIQSIALKIIVVTGDQETGWQAGHDVRVLRRYIGGRCV